MPQDEQDALKDHFNSLIDDEQDLGDILFGSNDGFESRIKFLDDDVVEEYTEEMLIQGVLDQETLEESLKENDKQAA